MSPAALSSDDQAIPRRLLTAEEAAKALGIGRTLVYELIGSGCLHSVRIGSCRRVPVAAIDEFVAELLSGADS
jgi:excisionase family DNA binding protein